MMHIPWRLLAAATATVLTAGLMSPAPAIAVEFSAARTILGSDCTKWLKWNGGLPEGVGHAPDPEPRGTVKFCWVKYELKSDRHADYFALSVQSTWKLKEGASKYPAEMHHAIRSTMGARQGVFGATGSYTSSESCSTPVTVGFSVGPFGVSTSPQICDNYGIQRYALDRTHAQWRSGRAAGLRSIETAFVQKVREGRLPKFDVVVALPRYDVHYYEAGGYWISKKKLKWISWSDR